MAEVSTLEPRTLLAASPLGAEARINAEAAGVQRLSSRGDGSVAVDLDGNGVVVWASPGATGRGSNIVARRVDPSGDPLGAEFLVNAT